MLVNCFRIKIKRVRKIITITITINNKTNFNKKNRLKSISFKSKNDSNIIYLVNNVIHIFTFLHHKI